MTYRPDSKDRKVIYLLARLTELGLEIKEDVLHRLVYRIQRKGARIGFEFEILNSEGYVFSYELAERLERLANLGYIKRYMIVERAYDGLYSYLYKVSEKGEALIKRTGVAQRDRKIIDEVVNKIKEKLKKYKAKRGVSK